MVRQPQTGPSSLAPVRVTGTEAKAPEENQDWNDAATGSENQTCGVALGFRARCDHGRPRVSLLDGER